MPKKLCSVLLVLLGVSVLAGAWTVGTPPRPANAQGGGDIQVSKRLGRTNPVVHVGEYLTFVITIRNNAAFAITTLPLSDDYDETILEYVDALPGPDSTNTAAGQLEWANLTTFYGGPLPAGAEMQVIVGFRATHPERAIVNRAWVHDALGASGGVSGTTETITNGAAIGGSSPLNKELAAGVIPYVGAPLTYTIVITNQGYVTLTTLPLSDQYNPAWMAFNYAVPQPDVVDPVNGILRWSDLTYWTGDVPPHGVVTVTTMFTALMMVENANNRALVENARDWYGNDLAAGADDVPIIIVPGPTPVTPTPTPKPRKTSTPQQPTATPTPIPLIETPTPTLVVLLPMTGDAPQESTGSGWLVLLLALGLGCGWWANCRKG